MKPFKEGGEHEPSVEKLLAQSKIPETYWNFARGLTDLSPVDRKLKMEEMAGINADFAEAETKRDIQSFLSEYDQVFPRREMQSEHVGAHNVDKPALAGEASDLSWEYGTYHSNDPVMVKRSNGSVESDWKFVLYDKKEGRIRVQKTGVDGKPITKAIRVSEFDATQKNSPGTPEPHIEAQPVSEGQGVKDILRRSDIDETNTKDFDFFKAAQALLRKNDFKAGDRIIFFDEQEREGVLEKNSDGGLSIRDAQGGLPWGIGGIFMGRDGYIRKIETGEKGHIEARLVPKDMVPNKVTSKEEPEGSARIAPGVRSNEVPQSPEERIVFWREKVKEWNNIFLEVSVHASEEKLAEAAATFGYDEKMIFRDLERVISLLDDHEELPLKKYRISIYEKGNATFVTKNDLIFLSLPDLMEKGPEVTAEFLISKIRKNEGIVPGVEESIAETGAPAREGNVEKTSTEILREHLDGKLEELDSEFGKVKINLLLNEEEEVILLRGGQELIEKFLERLQSLASLLSADPSMTGHSKVYFLNITDKHTGLLVSNSSKEIEIGLDVLSRDDKPMEFIERMISDQIHNKPLDWTDFDAQQAVHEKKESAATSSVATPVGSDVRPAEKPKEEEKKIEESVSSEAKEQLPDLEAARAAYIKAHEEYQKNNPWRAGSILNITGDTSKIEAARKAYDAALKAAAEKERGEKFETFTPIEKAKINKGLFDKFIAGEESKLNELRLTNLPPHEQSRYQQVWRWYVELPKWEKIMLSTTVGTAIAAGTGAVAGAGILYYAGRRAFSPLIAGSSTVATTGLLEIWDRSKWGRKDTKEYKINELLHNRADDISRSLDDMHLEYEDILNQQADREKKRTYLKVAIAALAGAGFSIGAGLAFGEHIPTTGGATQHVTDQVDHAVPSNVPVSEAAAQHIIEVHHGDSLWRITGNELAKDDAFKSLDDAQKTYVISTLTNQEIASHVAGTGGPDNLVVNSHIDLSSVLNNKEHLAQVMDHARHLTPAQQANILANNHAIATWLHEHPHEQLTGSRAEDIVKERLHPNEAHVVPVVENDPTALHLKPQTFHVNPVAHGLPVQSHEIFSPAPVSEVITPDVFGKAIQEWPIDPTKGQQLFDHLDMSHATPDDVHHLLSEAAQKVGDQHIANIDPADTAAVARQLKDYLVSYPEAQKLGFTTYENWAGIKNVSVKQFMDETMVKPDAASWKSALHHSFFHRGARIHEMMNGKLQTGPLEEHHLILRKAIDLAGAESAPSGMTMGDFLAEHHAAVDGHVAEALHLKELVQGRASQGTAAVDMLK
jgi:hypothetical protein